jgi:outer membrane protein assembly factor BamD (BamD/ComL family)
VETELAAQNQLYTRAMTARRNGDAIAALRALEEFVRLYPQAPLAQDARVEHFRTLVDLHDGAAAARAAREYLTLYPNGFARDEARAVAGASP